LGFRRLCGLCLLRLLAAALGRALVDQRDRIRQRDRILVLVAGNGRVDAARGDVSAIAAVLDRDRAERGVIAERLARIGAEAAAARALGDFLRDTSLPP